MIASLSTRTPIAFATLFFLGALGCTHVDASRAQQTPATAPITSTAPSEDIPPEAQADEQGEALVPDAATLSENVPEHGTTSRRAHLARATARVMNEIPDEPDPETSSESTESAEELEDEEDGEFDDIEESGPPACGNSPCLGPAQGIRPGMRYTADIEDESLAMLWKESPEALGSLSIGLPSLGRLVNARPFPAGEHWKVTTPQSSWATEETINYLTTAIAKVVRQFPEGNPIRVNHISTPNGGYLRPHQSHQSGRDVDLSFYYGANGPDRGPWAARHNFDIERNWALVRALITETDVQVILVDQSIIKRLYDHALSKGEDKAWLDSVFHVGANSLLRHARRHRDHYHVRFYNPRAQELGRRVLPMMPKDPRQNLRYHRVKKGDTLGKIAFAYGSTLKAIQQANRLTGTMIRIDQRLAIPLRGPCVNCPTPPEVIVPPRRLPPTKDAPLMALLYTHVSDLPNATCIIDDSAFEIDFSIGQ